ncbi:MAG: creatininase family protein, partial [Oscillospiraceae bacterium]|nr:creatininase family protein [Oscillospiraceae bacterium]
DHWTGEKSAGKKIREPGQLDGSAYWLPDDSFLELINCIFDQLQRAGFRAVVAHGHGPSTALVARHEKDWLEKYGLLVINCWGSEQDGEGMGIQVDHAGANETSLTMAIAPELVNMEALSKDTLQPPIAVSGKDPRIFASSELGEKIMELQLERMAKILEKITFHAPKTDPRFAGDPPGSR